MKGKQVFVTVLLIVFTLSSFNVYGKGIILEVDQPRVGIVIEVIDGNAFEVMYLSSTSSIPTTELIRLIGVDSRSNDDSYQYGKDQLLGKPVFILTDEAIPEEDGYKFAYLFLNTDETYNEMVLRLGLGWLDDNHQDAEYYEDLSAANFIALRQELGIYKTEDTAVNILNINTASSAQIKDHLDISTSQSNSIIRYREDNPINSSQELGFINDVFTREFIEDNRSSLHYMTDLNTATVYEMTTLFNASDAREEAAELSQVRIFTPFDEVEDIKYLSGVYDIYEDIEPFVTVSLNDNFYDDSDDDKVNINTASIDDLVDIGGLPTIKASDIKDLIDDTGYVFNSIEELGKTDYPLAYYDLDDYTDELTFRTNLNTAGETELISLFTDFGLSSTSESRLAANIMSYRPYKDYESIIDVIGPTYFDELHRFITIGEYDSDLKAPININTAYKKTAARYLGLSGDVYDTFIDEDTSFYEPDDIEFLNLNDMGLVTLYTNINEASYDELMNMHSLMTSTLADEIVEYRAYYPFYTLDELETFLDDKSKSSLYEQIEEYIVFY